MKNLKKYLIDASMFLVISSVSLASDKDSTPNPIPAYESPATYNKHDNFTVSKKNFKSILKSENQNIHLRGNLNRFYRDTKLSEEMFRMNPEGHVLP